MAHRGQRQLTGILIAGLFALVAGCAPKPPATKVSAPTPVFVRLASLEAAHPLQASLRELDAAAIRLRADSTAPVARAFAATDTTFAPTPRSKAGDTARNVAARNALRESATETLRRYIVARRRAGERIRAEKRAELEGIARAQSADEEAAARVQIENETRAAIFLRAQTELDTAIRRDAATVNLTPGNVVTLARDPETQLPSVAVLESQIAVLRANPTTPPRVSDEARLTNLLRDLEAELARLRRADDRDLAFQDALIADAIATIRGENTRRVEEQLANLPGRINARAEIADARRELLTLLENLRRTESASAANVAATGNTAQNAPPAIASATISPAQTANTLRGLSVARANIRSTIRRDVVAAVRDVGVSRNLAPTLTPAPALPDRTGDFSRWIFGNVRAATLSEEKTR
ncbi:MAG: hypothetical protein H7Y38_03975 [Armatimonadetes bacterium]|nr:hypothetical protein [Armatimonadota bacterium]